MVPVNVFYAPDELAYLLNNADCVAFISEPRFLSVYAEVANKCPTVRIQICGRTDDVTTDFQLLSDILRDGNATHRLVTMLPEAPSQIVFTSGTTSRPKGAIISHLATMLQGIAVAQVLGMTPDDRSCVVLPLFHVNAQFMSVVPTLTVGGTIVMIETYSATRFWDQVRKHDCTLMSIVPMQLRTMLAQTPHPDDAVHRVRLSFYALITTDEEWTRFEERFGVRLVEGYGLSETLGICTCNPAVFGQVKRHCIGLPVPGREIRVINEEGIDQPSCKPGRIMVRGHPMFSGYFKNPEATTACMVDGWFETGDNGFFDEDGYLHFFDRSKDVIKRAGELLRSAANAGDLNFHGNVEGNDIFKGTTDIVVCDGFVGNVALKASEGLATMIGGFLKQEFGRNPYAWLAALVAYPVLAAFKRRVDHRRYNGAALLGLRGLVFKSHGSADAFAFSQALARAYDAARNQLLERVQVRIAHAAPLLAAGSSQPADATTAS